MTKNVIGIGGIDTNFFDTATDVGATVGSEVSAAAATHFDTSDGKLAVQHEKASQKTVNTPGCISGELSHLPEGL